MDRLFEDLSEHLPKEIGFDGSSGDEDAANEAARCLDLLNNPDYAVVYEKHGWAHVKDFIEECDDLEGGADYALVFQVDRAKDTYGRAFADTLLGILPARNPGKQRNLSCDTADSQDGRNHFWLLKRT